MTKRKEVIKSKPSASRGKEIVFTCKFCEKAKPLLEMAVITRFSPPLVACKACEKTAF